MPLPFSIDASGVKSVYNFKDIGFEIIGWTGSACILTAFLHKWDKTSDFTLNLIGSIFLLAICLKKKIYQPACINIIWSIGSIIKYNKSN